MEEALGMSFAGKRALVCMKHVGMNVAADAFVNSAMTGANGGLVVVAADDPSMHSSQNEQDSRFYGKFALVPTFEPSTQQEAYEMVQAAFDFSEKYRIPVLMRLTTRMAHSRAMVEPREARPENSLAYPARTRQWVLMPGNSRVRYEALLADYARFEEEAAASPFSSTTGCPSSMMSSALHSDAMRRTSSCGSGFGDSTFTHSGMTGLLDAVNEGTNITVVISDNLTTGMTGGQDSAGTGRLEQICAGLGPASAAPLAMVIEAPMSTQVSMAWNGESHPSV